MRKETLIFINFNLAALEGFLYLCHDFKQLRFNANAIGWHVATNRLARGDQLADT
jgi:hypothetical protein